MARPGNGASNRRQITHNWWLLFVFLIIILDLLDFVSILMEEQGIFCFKTVLERRSVEDALELAE
jgi:hypothetical protein